MRISIADIIKNTDGKLIYGNDYIDKAEEIYTTSISSNSREIKEGGIFLAIPGEKVDGHKFVKGAYENGAYTAIVSKDIGKEAVPDGRFCVLVEDTVKAVQRLAAWYRKQFDLPVVAVSGSVGKTTTKEMIAAALNAGKNVLKTEGNMNSQLGVALMMFRLETAHDIAVIEMGISEPDEMNRLSCIAMPEAAVVTNIGVSHIGQLKTRENIRKEKLDIVRGFADKGVLFIPSSDEYLNAADAFSKDALSEEAYSIISNSDIIKYGETDECAYKAVNIHNGEDGVIFTVILPDNKTKEVHLQVLGLHNVYNALAAIAIADRYGVDLEAAITNIEKYQPLAMRGQIYEHKGITIIDDTYNASPDSMKSGLSVLWDKRCDGRRIALLADILELGDDSEELHRGIGKYIAEQANAGKVTDILYTAGAEASYIAEEAENNLNDKDSMVIEAFKTRDELLDKLLQVIKPGDMIMVKGSRGMQMDKVCEVLRTAK